MAEFINAVAAGFRQSFMDAWRVLTFWRAFRNGWRAKLIRLLGNGDAPSVASYDPFPERATVRLRWPDGELVDYDRIAPHPTAGEARPTPEGAE